MAWMETDYSKHTYFRWKVKWWLEHLGALGTMGETALLILMLTKEQARERRQTNDLHKKSGVILLF